MTADDRLNQLEPVIAEAITILDRHTYQLKQLTVATTQIIDIVTQQSESISFLLQEQTIIKTDVAGIRTDITGLQADMADVKTDMVGMNGKLDLLIQLIQKPNK